MLDNLMSDKNLKTSKEAELEVDQLITQLDQKHQERLKEILGTHYEAIRDQYEEYLESSQRE
jgi:t-SNARE complex subunit (syntaxin)